VLTVYALWIESVECVITITSIQLVTKFVLCLASIRVALWRHGRASFAIRSRISIRKSESHADD